MILEGERISKKFRKIFRVKENKEGIGYSGIARA